MQNQAELFDIPRKNIGIDFDCEEELLNLKSIKEKDIQFTKIL